MFVALAVLAWLLFVNQGCAQGLGMSAGEYATHEVIHWAIWLCVGWLLVRAWRIGLLAAAWEYARPWLERRLAWLRARVTGLEEVEPAPLSATELAQQARALCLQAGGGAYLGAGLWGRWVYARPEHAVMVLGPPRSGKTSAVVVPSILSAAGAVVSTSSKADVMDVTRRARAQVGEVWLFDPSGSVEQWPEGVRRLCWSPVPAAETWDGALLMARAMAAAAEPAKGTTNEHHWRERATALLAPLLHPAYVTDRQVADVLGWVLRGELDAVGKTLSDHGATMAADALGGIAKTDARERSSIVSATAGVLAAYNADAVRRNAAQPNFDPDRFVGSKDTVYVTAPAHEQALCAPLVVGLLEQIRHAAYRRAGEGGPPVYMCLDEVANIAPIHDLPALVSEAGGQGLHVLVCLQDLTGAQTLGRSGGRRIPVAVSDQADPGRRRRSQDAGSGVAGARRIRPQARRAQRRALTGVGAAAGAHDAQPERQLPHPAPAGADAGGDRRAAAEAGALYGGGALDVDPSDAVASHGVVASNLWPARRATRKQRKRPVVKAARWDMPTLYTHVMHVIVRSMSDDRGILLRAWAKRLSYFLARERVLPMSLRGLERRVRHWTNSSSQLWPV
jgi:hypothetical protein